MWSRQPGQLSVRAVLRHFAPYKGLVSLAGSALRSPPQARPPALPQRPARRTLQRKRSA